ncbi:50S ribosomal protein L32 [Candidatus Berkelbacteria bacterium]|nr:50S ribosomal protein L32 [Candidatus Berkelbacteria bacterium]
MAEPKKKRSRTRTQRARANQILEADQLLRCNQCGAQILPHTVCIQCGYYKKAKVIG